MSEGSDRAEHRSTESEEGHKRRKTDDLIKWQKKIKNLTRSPSSSWRLGPTWNIIGLEFP